MVKTQNVDTELLKKAIVKSGLKLSYIVDTLGMSRQAFHKKQKGDTPFRQSEVYVICDLLKLNPEESSKIFFPEKLGDNQTQEEGAE